MKLHPGWRESFTALGYGLVVLLILAVLVWALSGCAGTKVYGEYEHHSSAQDLRDSNESNQFGVVVAIPARFSADQCADYCPEVEFGLHWESRERVFGRNPVGTVRVRQPIWARK